MSEYTPQQIRTYEACQDKLARLCKAETANEPRDRWGNLKKKPFSYSEEVHRLSELSGEALYASPEECEAIMSEITTGEIGYKVEKTM